MKKAILVAMLFAVPSVANAQAWTRDPGQAYLSLSVTRLSGNALFNSDFSRQSLPFTYNQTLISTYGEVGIVKRWLTVSFNAELFRRNSLEDQGATFGLGDIRLGFWSGVIEAPFRLTLGVDFGIPTGDNSPDSDNPDDFQAQSISRSLPTGDGEFDVEPAVLLGHSFGGGSWPLRHFVVAKFGYWIRTSATIDDVKQSFSDAFNYRFELGTKIPAKVFDRSWLITRFYGTESFASNEEASQGTTGIGNGVTHTSFGVEVTGRIVGGLSAAFGIDGAFRARSIISGVPLRFTLSYEL